MEPIEVLRQGVVILDPVCAPHGFRFCNEQTGRGSGGLFASGEYVRGDRRFELHFRASLGLVTYHVGPLSLPHDEYLRALRVLPGECAYPGFSDDPLDGFRHLKTDLERFGQEFLAGDASVFLNAARAAAERQPEDARRNMARAVGDDRSRQRARELFRLGKYAEVVAALDGLKYAEFMDSFERKILDVARRRAGSS
jgi:hypothetical protein